MTTSSQPSLHDLLASLPADILAKELRKLKPAQLEAIYWSWSAQARPNQRLPEGIWTVWLLLAGRGFGKTRTGAEATKEWVEKGARRLALVAATPADARDVMIEGEALALDTPIPTPNGWTILQDLRVGHFVFSSDGTPTQIIAVSEIWDDRPCYRVGVDGASEALVADARHQWVTRTRSERVANRPGWRSPSARTTEEIGRTLRMRHDLVNHEIPIHSALDLPWQLLPVPPYTLGAWLGDGDTRGKGSLSCHDDDSEIMDRIRQDGFVVHRRSGKYEWGICKLAVRLRIAGVAKNKHVPCGYLRASKQQRLDLLRGLMDTDGTVGSTGQCAFDNTNLHLMLQIRELILTLGFKAGKIQFRKANGHYKQGYRIVFKCAIGNPIPFHLKRKAERCTVGVRSNGRLIRSVEVTQSVPVRCIQVGHPSGTFLAGSDFVITHNSGLLNIYPPRLRPNYQSSKRRVTFHNGAIATIYSAHKHSDKSGLRGPQHEKAWGDEPAKWQYPDNVDQLMLGLRLGQNPQAVFTGTPRSIPLIRDWIKETRKPNSSIRLTLGTTYENRANLAESWFTRIINKYTGTRLGEQELLAKILDDVQGALWTYKMIQTCMDDVHSLEYLDIVDARGERIVDGINQTLRDSMERVVVAVDPSVSDGKPVDVTAEQTAETGIMVCGRRQDKGHLLEDASLYAHPSEWAQRAVDMFHRWNADYIVAEKNNGGELVRLTIQSVPGARNIPVKLVTASRGKYTRAEPVALLHERGGIKHHLVCPALEDQLTTWVPGMKSPDRLDAYVWGMTELLVDLLTFGISMAGENDDKKAEDVQKDVVGVQEIDRTILGAIRRGGLYFPNGG